MARYSFVVDGNYVDFKDGVNVICRLHNSSRCIEWRYDDTTGIRFRIDEFEYQTDSMSNIEIDGDVLSAQSDFGTAIVEIFPGLAGGSGPGGGIESVVAGDGIEVDDTDPANPVVSATGGAGALQSTTVTLTDAQIKALPTTPIQVVAAQGANTVIFVERFIIGLLNDTAGAYTNVSNNVNSYLELIYGAGYDDDGSVTLMNLENQFTSLTGGGICFGVGITDPDTFDPVVFNKGLFLYCDNAGSGPFTGGNAANTLDVTVFYTVVEL